jgi:hypothetical protein
VDFAAETSAQDNAGARHRADAPMSRFEANPGWSTRSSSSHNRSMTISEKWPGLSLRRLRPAHYRVTRGPGWQVAADRTFWSSDRQRPLAGGPHELASHPASGGGSPVALTGSPAVPDGFAQCRSLPASAVRRVIGFVGICGLLLTLSLSTPAPARQSTLPATGKWTLTNPPINLVHIETGEINRRGEPVGYHHRPNGVDPPGAKVIRIIQPPDANGVYRARVALRDPADGEWIDKRAASTFFPDAMSQEDVIHAIITAFRSGERRRDGEFVGDSNRGFMIEGWYQSGRINAAYPLQGP